MPVLITERNARTLTQSENDRGGIDLQATRVFDVTGVADGTEAFEALATRTPDPINIGASHPQDTRAAVVSFQQEENTVAGMWTYTVNYSSQSASSTEGVLLEPPVIGIKSYRFMALQDHDANGVPFVTTSNFPFEGGTPVEQRGIKWSYSRWEATYNWDFDNEYGGFTNSNVMNLPGIAGNILPGQAKFEGVEQGERSSISPVVRNTYVFDLRKSGHTNDVIDQAAVGYAQNEQGDDGPEKVGVYIAGSRASEPLGPVRLNGEGLPIAENVKVAPFLAKAFDPAPPPNGPSPSIAVISPPTSEGGKSTYPANPDGIVVLSFAQAKSVNMVVNL